MNGQEQQTQQEGNEMSNIEIKQREKFWEASDGAWSINGQDWFSVDGNVIFESAKYRAAIRNYLNTWIGPRIIDRREFSDEQAHLDITTEPQRAKAGDWVKSKRYPDKDSFKVEVVTEHTVSNDAHTIQHGHYTIVPDPTPEPEVFTGDPSTWGKGWYREVDGPWTIFVDNTGEWSAVSEEGFVLGSRRSKGFSIAANYHRISDNPADGVKWEGGEG